jgi:hypothetical protein
MPPVHRLSPLVERMQSFTREEDLLDPTPLQFDLEAVDMWPCAAVVRQPHTATAAVRQQLRDLLVPEGECEEARQVRPQLVLQGYGIVAVGDGDAAGRRSACPDRQTPTARPQPPLTSAAARADAQRPPRGRAPAGRRHPRGAVRPAARSGVLCQGCRPAGARGRPRRRLLGRPAELRGRVPAR